MKARSQVSTSLLFLLAMTVLLGFAYPALTTAIAQLAFPGRANGSLVSMGGSVRGSYLLAQDFSSPRFFSARPSAADYAAVGAGASNLGPTSADLAKAVADRKAAWAARFGSAAPEDMLYASGSGVDPDISPEAALAQVGAVVAARGLGQPAAEALAGEIRARAASRSGPIDPPLVNVVSLNVLIETDPRFSGRR